MISIPAIFLDRDGVINENPDYYVKSLDEFHFLPGTLQALQMLAELPWPIFIATNQSVVGRKIISLEDLDNIHAGMLDSIRKAGGRIDGIYICPHAPEAGCTCRKPQPGLLIQAAEEHHLNLQTSLFIGDSQPDIQAANAVSMPAVLINAFGGQSSTSTNEQAKSICKFGVASSLYDVADTILSKSEGPVRWKSPSELVVYFAKEGKRFEDLPS